MYWHQTKLTLPNKQRGFHLITDQVLQSLPELRHVGVGFLNLFLQHTSASLSLNENADPSVRHDMEIAANKICPEISTFTHTLEGLDDMPGHVKSSIFGVQLNIPVRSGQPALGIWQGIYLCEHRNNASARSIIATLWGQKRGD